MIDVPGLTQLDTSSGTKDDWTTYAHDYRRTGFEDHQTSVTTANVSQLALRWRIKAVSSGYASPIVAYGAVFVAGLNGDVIALSAKTGKTIWQRTFGKSITMTPTLADGRLFVGTHDNVNDFFAALDARTGKTVWSTPMPSCVRGEPAVVNGVVYEGESCGDPPGCHVGGIDGLDENSGAVLFSWKTNSVPNNGGGQWSPISYDGSVLYFGTGNVCTAKAQTADAVVAMNPMGARRWAFQPVNPIEDDDFGGGEMINNGQVFVTGKNGYLYDLDASSGTSIWSTYLGSIDGYGPIGTPTTDGTLIVTSIGYLSDPTKTSGPPLGGIAGVDSHGNIRWTINTLYSVPGYAAIANGIAFADLDSTIDAIDLATGTRLWTYPALAKFYASPVVVPSGLYAVDDSGNVYAFTLPA